jgi:nonribosomal peptide synthetase DhbF
MLDGFGNGHSSSRLSVLEQQAVERVCESNVRIVSAFSPRPFEGDVVLFVAGNSHTEPPSHSWKAYVDGRIKVHRLDCTHDEIMDATPAASVGRVLTKELDRQRTIKQSFTLWRTK